eukprot:6650091-Prymnesium_polylepis.1
MEGVDSRNKAIDKTLWPARAAVRGPGDRAVSCRWKALGKPRRSDSLVFEATPLIVRKHH